MHNGWVVVEKFLHTNHLVAYEKYYCYYWSVV